MSFLKRVQAFSSEFQFESDFELDASGSLPGVSAEYHVKSETKVKIKYEIEFESRSWGIKGLSVFIPKQDITFNVELDEEEETAEVKMSIDNSKTKFESGDDLGTSFGIVPKSIEIYKGVVTVSFGVG